MGKSLIQSVFDRVVQNPACVCARIVSSNVNIKLEQPYMEPVFSGLRGGGRPGYRMVHSVYGVRHTVMVLARADAPADAFAGDLGEAEDRVIAVQALPDCFVSGRTFQKKLFPNWYETWLSGEFIVRQGADIHQVARELARLISCYYIYGNIRLNLEQGIEVEIPWQVAVNVDDGAKEVENILRNAIAECWKKDSETALQVAQEMLALSREEQLPTTTQYSPGEESFRLILDGYEVSIRKLPAPQEGVGRPEPAQANSVHDRVLAEAIS
jgi:hypothetical protein